MNEPTNKRLPAYAGIAEVLRAELTPLPEGTPIATERELMQRFQVSRGTIRQAIAELVKDGLIRRTQGSGSFRAQARNIDRVFAIDPSSLQFISEVGQISGVSKFSCSLVRATNAVADTLQIPRGTKVRRVYRIRTINGRPFAVGEALARADLLKQIPGQALETSLGDYVAKVFNLPLCDRRCICTAVAADEGDAAALHVAPGTPLMQFEFYATAVGVGPFIIDTVRFVPEYRLNLNVLDRSVE